MEEILTSRSRHDQQHSSHPDKMKHTHEKSKLESHPNKKK